MKLCAMKEEELSKKERKGVINREGSRGKLKKGWVRLSLGWQVTRVVGDGWDNDFKGGKKRKRPR